MEKLSSSMHHCTSAFTGKERNYLIISWLLLHLKNKIIASQASSQVTDTLKLPSVIMFQQHIQFCHHVLISSTLHYVNYSVNYLIVWFHFPTCLSRLPTDFSVNHISLQRSLFLNILMKLLQLLSSIFPTLVGLRSVSHIHLSAWGFKRHKIGLKVHSYFILLRYCLADGLPVIHNPK